MLAKFSSGPIPCTAACGSCCEQVRLFPVEDNPHNGHYGVGSKLDLRPYLNQGYADYLPPKGAKAYRVTGCFKERPGSCWQGSCRFFYVTEIE